MTETGAHIEAELRFLTTSEGGRRGRVRSGYRTVHNFDLGGALTDATHIYQGVDIVNPGESATAHLTLVDPHPLRHMLREGANFTVQEGLKIIAYGRITKIFDEALRAPHP